MTALFPDEGQLFLPGEGLDGVLPLQGGGFVLTAFPVDRLQGATASGIFGSLSCLMLGQAAVKIIGDAGVERAVLTPKDVDAPAFQHGTSMAQRAVRMALQMAATSRWRGSFL